jgi:hypothetical protein
MRRTFNQVVTLGDVREQLVEVCIAFATGHSEAGDGHEVCGNVVHIVGRLVVGLIVVGGVVTGFNERWSSGTIAGGVPGEFEGPVISGRGRNGLLPSTGFVDGGLFELFGEFGLGRHGHGKSRDRNG